MVYSSNLDAESDDIRIHILSDDSGYYVFGQDSSSIANIWKYSRNVYFHYYLY